MYVCSWTFMKRLSLFKALRQRLCKSSNSFCFILKVLNYQWLISNTDLFDENFSFLMKVLESGWYEYPNRLPAWNRNDSKLDFTQIRLHLLPDLANIDAFSKFVQFALLLLLSLLYTSRRRSGFALFLRLSLRSDLFAFLHTRSMLGLMPWRQKVNN